MNLARALALVLATSPAGCLLDTTCHTTYDSAQTNYAGMIASGNDLIAVMWFPELGTTAPLAAIVSPTGEISNTASLPPGFDLQYMPSATGHTSAMWLVPVDDGLSGLEGAVLGSNGVTKLMFSTRLSGFSSAIVFDGHSYQVFWVDADRLHYTEVSEQGAPGDAHDLGPASDVADVFAVTDPAGAVYVVLADYSTHILALDPAAGTAHEIWSGDGEDYSTAFWRDGEIHLRDDVWTDQIDSFDPAKATWRTRPMPAELDGLLLYPTETSLYAWDYVGTMYELDSNLAVTTKHRVGRGYVGTFGSDWAVIADLDLDEQTLTPGRVQLTRGVGGSNDVAWKTDVVVDSAVVVGQSCTYDRPAESQNPGE